MLALRTCVGRVVYGFTEFHPNLLKLQQHLPCIALSRRNLPSHVEYLIARYDINVIYSLLNAWDGSTEATLELLDSDTAVPIVRHYKEHPCSPTLEERRVLLETAAQVYINKQSLEFFRRTYDVPTATAHVLDADMISVRHMRKEFAPRLRTRDGKPHLLIGGGFSMLHDRFDVRELCAQMVRRDVHVHLYGYFRGVDSRYASVVPHAPTRRMYLDFISQQEYLHWGGFVPPEQFTVEWSQYDAGLMHVRVSPDDPEAAFENMNVPCRYTAYLAAGLPIIGAAYGQAAMREIIETHRIGATYGSYDALAEQLWDENLLGELREVAIRKRYDFAFEASVGTLGGILRAYAGIEPSRTGA